MKASVNLTFGSVCSGIEAASCAWLPLGWKAEWLSEIEPFPSSVLAYRHPDTPNLGDMTLLPARIISGDINAPDVLVGGTPCQAFSIAGLRNGLEDARGALTLKYVELANAIDDTRIGAGHQPAIDVWENVPGVLTSKDNAFGCFLAGLAGEDEALEPGDRPKRGKSNPFWRWDAKTRRHIAKWPQSGCVVGPQRKVAWRVIDAQYVGVAQRRRRVFVVASARTDVDPVQILLEFDGVRRDIAPRREARAITSALTANGVGVRGADDNQAQAGHLIAVMAHGQAGAEIKLDGFAPTLTCNHEAPIVFSSGGAGCWSKGVGTLRARQQESHEHLAIIAFPQNMSSTQYATPGAVCPTLMSRNPTAVAFSNKGDGFTGEAIEVAGISANSGWYDTPLSLPKMTVRRLTPLECERLQGFPDGWTLIPAAKRKKVSEEELAYICNIYPDIDAESAYRLAVDGPRYKAIGNSMAVPVMRWIGERIADAIASAQPATPARVTHLRHTRAPAEYERPIFKWVGGKFSVMPILSEHLPHGKRLIEPFVGGGSVFTNAGYREYLLNDVNGDLINFYQVLQREAHTLITLVDRYFQDYNTSSAFLDIRDKFNNGEYDDLHHAAAFLYLNRHCFNGLIRYNLKGHFNVGYGKYKAPYFPLIEMEAFLGESDKCKFVNGDFGGVIEAAGADDVIFCDPPYEPLPDTNGFTNYSGHGFPFTEQERLVSLLVAAHKRGAKVVITNSGAPNIQELYRANGFSLHQLPARRSVSCKGETRTTANDVLAKLL
ncbi:Dam family site-specific DNA-(adenine-N6)-methyltransferase (plasmid) [Raoultella ornithinolytica]|uniref:Dam family site-specific DNA-(adenine-N6)-methyltransferase n=1 Tax=Raoultella ornithinolytica TaxID=54291 RepID=UPI00292AB72B|nr:Dam family site-specific DNA-(adenine-N6)-methyltransferase [Raoultella ornithinolytica]MDV1094972.1 Dam family site-specific DNA-(adenine-N6)-methyltransferase [Raoultella ornithinolytica]MDV1122684.1 Dam family site-specific DNA-(adenine-N6)-methyltransferase [Raoultella ornithinolytica]MDV1893199.1 Dam family site-specific DNA-(adenine-N6)-methyltransferase [Raoultella ornithinolytica]